MKKLTLKKGILIALAVVLFMGVLSSNVFATQPIVIQGGGQSAASYTVTFNTIGGSTVASQTVVSGGTATKPLTNPTRDGYTFDDWYADSAYTTKFDFTQPITANTTVYAKWTTSAAVTPTPTTTPTTTPAKTTDDSSLPQTGDASDYAIFALIGVCAVVSIVAFVKTKKYNLK